MGVDLRFGPARRPLFRPPFHCLLPGVPEGEKAEFERRCPPLDPTVMLEQAALWHVMRMSPVQAALAEVDRAHVAFKEAIKGDTRVQGTGVLLEGMALRNRFMKDHPASPVVQRMFHAERLLSTVFATCYEEAVHLAAQAVVDAAGMHGPAWVLVQVAGMEIQGVEVPTSYRDAVAAYVQEARQVLDAREPSRAVDLQALLLDGEDPTEVGAVCSCSSSSVAADSH